MKKSLKHKNHQSPVYEFTDEFEIIDAEPIGKTGKKRINKKLVAFLISAAVAIAAAILIVFNWNSVYAFIMAYRLYIVAGGLILLFRKWLWQRVTKYVDKLFGNFFGAIGTIAAILLVAYVIYIYFFANR